MSGEKPVFDDPEAVVGITDALRPTLGREPTSAEVNVVLEQLRRFKWNEPEPRRGPSITVAELNAKAKEYWNEHFPDPAPLGPEAIMVLVAEAWRGTVRHASDEAKDQATALATAERVSEPAKKRRGIGDDTLNRVQKEAVNYKGSSLTREQVAEFVAPGIGLSVDRTLKLLRKLKIPT